LEQQYHAKKHTIWVDRSLILLSHWARAKARGLSKRTLHAFPRSKYLVACFGYIWPGKGIEYAIRALPYLRNVLGDVHLLIIGSAPPDELQYMDYLSRLVCDLGLTEETRILNRYVAIDEAIRYLKMASAIVFPYTKQRQLASSGALRIAIGLRKPIVASDLPPIREALEGGTIGFLAPPEDHMSLGSVILDIMTNGVKRENLLAGIDAHLQANDERKLVRSIMEIYDLTITQRPPVFAVTSNIGGRPASANIRM
jgi:glycosyltransferase involved in cell wall biosynthesis